MEVYRFFRMTMLLALLGFALIITGCAKTPLTGGLFKPHQAISIPSLDEIEKNQSMKVVTTKGYLNPRMLTEAVNGGGVWKVDILTEDGRILEGLAFIGEVDPYMNFVLEIIVFDPEGASKNPKLAKAVYYNRAGTKVFNLFGKPGEFNKDKDKKDENCRKETIERCGSSFQEINSFWNNYYTAIGFSVEKDFPHIENILVGTPRWQEYKKFVATIMGFYMKLPSGEVRQSYLPEDIFAHEASRNHGLTFMDRFLKHWYPGISMADLQIPGSGLATSVISAGLKACFDKTTTGYYDTAQVVRGELGPVFENVIMLSKMMLAARDNINAQLKAQNEKLWTVVNSLAAKDPEAVKAVIKQFGNNAKAAKTAK